MSVSKNATASPRVPFLDDLRGLAVVAMFVWHTTDAWLRPSLKAGEGFTALRIFGGMAAPLFLFLAGAAAALKLEAAHSRGRPLGVARQQLAARGLGVLVVGYGLRLSMWLIDGTALLRLSTVPMWLPMLAELGLAWLATEDWARGLPRARMRAVAGVGLWALGLFLTGHWTPQRLPGLLRVDVLQSIGASLALVALLAPMLRLPERRVPSAVLGAIVMLVTEPLGRILPGALPGAVAGYLGAWPAVAGVGTMGMFPLAPWLGYALFGAVFGLSVGHARSREALARTLALGAALFAGLGALAGGDLHYVQTLTQALPSSAKLVRAVHRVGIATSVAGLLHLLERPLAYSPLRVFGKTSLLLYCVHLEFAYGLASRPIAHRLGYGQWLVGLLLLCAMMYGLARLRLHPNFGSRAGRGPGSPDPRSSRPSTKSLEP